MAELSLVDRWKARFQSRIALPFEHRVRAPVRRLRNSRRTYQPLFVTGTSGGGTSLLAVSLAQGIECAGLVYECDAQISHRSFLHVPSLARFRSVSEYEAFITPQPDWSEEQARTDVQAMLRAYATAPGDWMVAKGPDIHLARAAFLQRCFPEAAFVAIFRDPAANIEGLRRKWRVFGEDSLEACIRFYSALHERFLEAMVRAPDRVLLVDYADLVARPSATLSAIRLRLGLAAASNRVKVPDAPNAEGKGIRNVRANRVEMVGDADLRARARLVPGDLATIDSALVRLHAHMRGEALAP